MNINSGNHRFRKMPSLPEPKRHVREHPNIHALFKKRYRVLARSRDLVSIEEQREHGMVSTGNRRLDDMLSNQLTTTFMSVNEMVEYFKEGISFRLTAAGDSKQIYEDIVAHTGAWRETLMYSMNVGSAPVEDLIELENFAAAVYEHARFEFAKPSETKGMHPTLIEFLFSKPTMESSTQRNGEYMSVGGDNSGVKTKELVHVPDVDIFKRAVVSQLGGGVHGRE